MTKRHSNFIRIHTKLFVFLIVFIFIIVLVMGRLFYERAVVSDMKSIADQIITPDEWTLSSEHHLAPYLFCVADEPCPHYVKSWSVSGLVSDKVLNDIISTGGLSTPDSTNCIALSETEFLTTCTKTSYYNNFKVSVYYTLDSSDRKTGRAQLDISR